MKVGDLVKRAGGRRTHWVGLVVGFKQIDPEAYVPKMKKFLVRWFSGPSEAEEMWEADFSLEIVKT